LILLIMTILSHYTHEKSDWISFGFACFAFLGMVPFVLKYSQYANHHPDNNKDNYKYAVVSSVLDFVGSISFVALLICIKRVCIRFKPSQLRYDTTREPSIAEIGFFISFWASIIAIIPMLISDINFKDNCLLCDCNLRHSTSLWELLSNKHVIYGCILGVALQTLQIYVIIGCLAVMKALSTAVITQLNVVIQVAAYYLIIERSDTHLSWWKVLCLIIVTLSCIGYGATRIYSEKGSKSWPMYFEALHRMNSMDSIQEQDNDKKKKKKKEKKKKDDNKKKHHYYLIN